MLHNPSRLLIALAACACALQARSDEVVFADALTDPALPGWKKPWKPDTPVKLEVAPGPNGGKAIQFSSTERVVAVATHDLPVASLTGKSVIFSIWRKADGIVTGDKHYRNAKTMLMWRGKSDKKVMNPGTPRTDLKGTTDWEFHRYMVHFPDDLQFARVHIGLEGCSGTARFADLKITVTDRFPDEAAFDRFLADEQEKALNEAARGPVDVRPVPGGVPRVFAGEHYIPWELWTKSVGQRVLAAAPAPSVPAGNGFANAMARSLLARADELAAGLNSMSGATKNQRIAAIAGLRARATYVLAGAPEATMQEIDVVGHPVRVSPLVFGNNVNAEHLSAAYDAEKGSFLPGFLERVRPMGIRFLRYPGGCNADVFNWRESVGPMDQRGQFVNYHNNDPRGPMKPGVDDVLRWCEQDGMVPILTTAFLYDKPDRIDLANSTRRKLPPYVAEYLKTAEDRVTLAADWVEYCNGSTDTPMGKLRARNGHPKPYGVKYWEVGNESWGADPVGSTTAELYAKAFPAYVKAMKARDPSIQVLLNGSGHQPEWNDTLLRIAGKQADGMQIHIYQTPAACRSLRPNPRLTLPVGLRARNLRREIQANPGILGDLQPQVDGIPARLDQLKQTMEKHLGHTLPVFVTEFGMGNATDREVMTSQTSAVLVADMLRVFLSTPLIQGTNKWALYGGYWFSQVNGPSRANPKAPFYIRPERDMHEIFARCRSDLSLPSGSAADKPVAAVVFGDPTGNRAVLINRSTTEWAKVSVAAIATARPAEALLLSPSHPLLGNETDHGLVCLQQFRFDQQPGRTLVLPPMSILGVILNPR